MLYSLFLLQHVANIGNWPSSPSMTATQGAILLVEYNCSLRVKKWFACAYQFFRVIDCLLNALHAQMVTIPPLPKCKVLSYIFFLTAWTAPKLTSHKIV